MPPPLFHTLHPRITLYLKPLARSLPHFSRSSPSSFKLLPLNPRLLSSVAFSQLPPETATGGERSVGQSAPPRALEEVQKVDVNPPKGARDFPPEDMSLRNWLFNNFKEVSRLYGFEEVDFQVLEAEALFIRKAGEEIRDQLYCFEDRGNRRIALRPELTPSLARLVIQKGKSVPLPLKWLAVGQCWRYERMTMGTLA